MSDRADEIKFFNRKSGLKATNMQAAIEEIAASGGKVELVKRIQDVGSGRIMTTAEREKMAGVERGATADQAAHEVPISATKAGVKATNVEGAIAELSSRDKRNAGLAHFHENADQLEKVSDAGSGKVITDGERRGLHDHVNLDVLSTITDTGSGGVIKTDERNKLRSIEPGATRDQEAPHVPLVRPVMKCTNVQGALELLEDNVIRNRHSTHIHLNTGIIDNIESAGSGRVITDTERDKLAGIEAGATADQAAGEVPFTDAGLIINGKTLQEAIASASEHLRSLLDRAHVHMNDDQLQEIYSAGSGAVITEDEREKLGGIEPGATEDQDASEVPYSCDHSKLKSTNLQDAVDEIAVEIGHKHENANILNSIEGSGSGRIISDIERKAIGGVVNDLMEHVADFERHVFEDETALHGIQENAHIHNNWDVLASIENLGSGYIITREERRKLNTIEANAKDDQNAREVLYGGPCPGDTVGEALDVLAQITSHLNDGAHPHSNLEVLKCVRKSGSGCIIGDDERGKLAGIEVGATADQKADEVPCDDKRTVQDHLDQLHGDCESISVINHVHENSNVLDRVIGPGSGSIITDDERRKLQGMGPGAKLQAGTDVPYDGKVVSAVNVSDAIDKVGGTLESLTRSSHIHQTQAELDRIVSAGSGKIMTLEEREKLAGMGHGAAFQSAVQVPLFGKTAGLEAENVQHAIQELAARGTHEHTNGDVLAKIKEDTCITPEERKKLASIESGATGPQDAEGIRHSNGRSVAEQLFVDEMAIAGMRHVQHKHENGDLLASLKSAGSGAVISQTEREKLNKIEDGATGDQSAHQVLYKEGFSVGDVLDTQGKIIGSINDRAHGHERLEVLEKVVDAGSGCIMTREERIKLQNIEDKACTTRDASEIDFGDGTTVADTVGALDGAVGSLIRRSHTHTNAEVVRSLSDAGSGEVITKAEREKLKGIEPFASRVSDASDIPFRGPGFQSINLQDAMVELATMAHFHANQAELDAISDAGSGSILSDKERDKLANMEYNSKDDQEASEVAYDNMTSGIQARTVQDAIDIIAGQGK